MRKHLSAVIFVVAMIVAFTSRVGDFKINEYVRYAIAAGVILWAIADWLRKRSKGKKNKELIFFAKIYLIPVVVIHLYSLVMSLIGVMDIKYLGTNLITYIPVLLALSGVQLFSKKSLKYSLIALVITWCVAVLGALISYGFGIFPFAIMQGYLGESTPILGVSANIMEMHDLVLTTACILVSFVFFRLFREKPRKYSALERIIIVVMVAAFLLGLKRISVLAVIAASVFLFVINKISENAKKKMYSAAGIILGVVSFAYVALLFSGEGFYNVMDSVGINMMGRDYYFKAIVEEGDFSPTFLGTGRNSVAKKMANDYSYMGVGGVHNDLLKMYIENGFVLFILWVWYYTIWMTKKYGKKYGSKAAILYLSMTICTFILYMTDNVENYYMYQFFYIMIPIVYATSIKDKTNLVESNRKS